MHWDDLKDDDLICVTQRNGSYFVDKKNNLNENIVRFNYCTRVKKKKFYFTMDEMIDLFIDKIEDVYIDSDLLLQELDYASRMDTECFFKKLKNSIKETININEFPTLTCSFNKIASDLNFFEELGEIYFDEKEPISPKMPCSMTLELKSEK